jgi:hypothetical protein
MFRYLQGFLCLLGHKRKAVREWSGAKSVFRKEAKALRERMADLIILPENGDKAANKRWTELELSHSGLDLKTLEQRVPESIKVLMRWLAAVQMAHNIAVAVDKEQKPPAADPVADRIFDDIDVRRSDRPKHATSASMRLAHMSMLFVG